MAHVQGWKRGWSSDRFTNRCDRLLPIPVLQLCHSHLFPVYIYIFILQMEELLHITAESWKCLMLLAWRRRSGSSECPVGASFTLRICIICRRCCWLMDVFRPIPIWIWLCWIFAEAAAELSVCACQISELGCVQARSPGVNIHQKYYFWCPACDVTWSCVPLIQMWVSKLSPGCFSVWPSVRAVNISPVHVVYVLNKTCCESTDPLFDT